MKYSTRQILFTTITIIFLLAACAPAPAPTPSPEEIEDLVATSVALTVASQNLETAEAQPLDTATPLPTATAVDTPTAVPPIDTATAVPLPTTVPSGGGGGTTSKPEFSCDSMDRRPRDNTIYKPGDRFDIKWTIFNNGTKPLRAGLDLKFSHGDKLMADRIVELPALDPGEQFVVGFDAVAPDQEGTYVMVYMVEGPLCYPYTAIVVEK
ncbi:MAG TPA: NBR1-Ig-like domain-containing protein [Anaerolineales bacterium]|nr:NBR1-Ig-like domain-containing protein [Anaerolineales bacterium]